MRISMDILLLDTDDTTFKANQKINHNLAQLNPNIRLLPESVNDPDVNGMPFSGYLNLVNETIYHNSRLIGFLYPWREIKLESHQQAVKKIYEPIAKYFEHLSMIENINLTKGIDFKQSDIKRVYTTGYAPEFRCRLIDGQEEWGLDSSISELIIELVDGRKLKITGEHNDFGLEPMYILTSK